VACGRLDAYFEEGLSPWDIAAGRLIAGESGATISHYDYDHPSQRRTQEYPGELFADNLVAATPLLLPKLLATLNEHTSS
jgi:myo-inositol-1(or 4)-monophosphatase